MAIEKVINLRHRLHQFPELSGNERETARHIVAFCRQYRPTRVVENLGGYGLASIYEYGTGGPTIMIRCELDALPIDEKTILPYKSEHRGISHKCGHDGHMAVVAGLSPWLEKQSFRRGRVILLFQGAEETGKGAQSILKDPDFISLRPDLIYSFHNIPGIDKNEVVIIPKQFSATVQSGAIYLEGLASHAAEPELGNNPAGAISELTQQLNDLNHSDDFSDDFTLITPIYLNMGEKDYGISPGRAEFHFTCRTWGQNVMNDLQRDITQHATQITDRYGLILKIIWFDYFPPVINHPDALFRIQQVCDRCGYPQKHRKNPFRFGEDFGWYTKAFSGSMFGLGAGKETPNLHHPDYDFPDDIIKRGINIFQELITESIIRS